MPFLQRFIWLALTVSLFSVSGRTATSLSAAQAQDGTMKTHRFRQDDYRRRYKLYTPANADALDGPRPLVLIIHGGGSADRGMIKLDKKRWQHIADQHGLYLAYPNAIDRLWDFGEGDTSDALDNRVDDLAYFDRVMTHASARADIDQSRIFATGISRGGQSSYYLACNLPGRIRAIAPVAMSLPKFMYDECQNAPPMPVAIFNGTADPQVPYEGGRIVVFKGERDMVLSTADTAALWRGRNGCSDAPSNTAHIDKPGDKTSVDVTEWSTCTGAPVKLYQINNGGHTWPSGIQYLGTRIVGHTSRDISASDEAWAFFSQF